MTWNELKDFCNSLPESFLEKNVIMWREEECISDISARQLEQDHYIESGVDEGCYPEHEAIEKVNASPEEYPNGLSDLRKCYDKGHPILEEN